MDQFRCFVFALAAVFLIGCSDADPTNPAETNDAVAPSFAKGGKKKPGGEPVLQEYWVIPGEQGEPDMIHVVVEGNVASVNPQLIYDYFFNGLRDDDPPDDQHYELSYQGPPDTPVEVLDNGLLHVDIPWDGRRTNDDPNDLVRDHLSIELPGEGDPYVFRLFFYDGGGQRVGVITPRGIVVGGEETDPPTIEGTPSPFGLGLHPDTEARSYATFEGVKSGQHMSLSDLTMTDLQCKKATQTSGKGKNRVVETVYRLSAQVSVSVDRPFTPPDPNEWNVWWEGHFRDVRGGDLSHRVAASNVGDYEVSLTMPPSWPGSGEIEFVVDFFSGIDLTREIVYDPWQNVPTTTAGFAGPSWTVERTGLSDGMAFPVAHSESFPVVCH